MKRLLPKAPLLAAILTTSWAHAADVIVGTPPTTPQSGQSLQIELFVDLPGDILGGYQFSFEYDPAVVQVVSIGGGTTTEFQSPPITNPATFASGSTPLAAVQGNPASPSGFLSVATVTLQAVGLPADATDLDLMVPALTNALAESLEATVFPSSLVIALPEVPVGLRFDSATALSWPMAPDIPLYNLYRGNLPDQGTLQFDHDCLAADVAGTSTVDTDAPAVGFGFYYLVGAERNDFEGPLGFQSQGQIRPNFFTCSPNRAPLVRARGERRDSPRTDREQPFAGVRSEADRPAIPPLVGNGDIDGDTRLTASDVRWLLEHLVGARELEPSARMRADANGDGSVDLSDAHQLQRYVEIQTNEDLGRGR